MNGTSDGVSKRDILLAIIELSDKLNVFEANIINLVDVKLPENEKAVHEQVNETKETVVNSVSCVEPYEIPKDFPAIPRFPLLVKWKNVLMNISVQSDAGIKWLLLITSHCIRESSYESFNKKTKRHRMLTFAGKFWFIEDKSEYFKPFKELTQQWDSVVDLI